MPSALNFTCYFLKGLALYMLVSSVDNPDANSLDPDQARQNVGPDLDPNCLTHR